MNLDPHIEQLATILLAVAVRELQAARNGYEKARTDGNRVRANRSDNDKYNPIRYETSGIEH